jgi:glyoxylase-like metal-dependent hydrolase (beta-lactamase superfamily II)
MLVAGFPAGPLAANCYLLAPGAGADCVVVDPGQAALDRLDAVLDQHRLRPVAVLLTHGHLDHVASARAVCARADVPAYLHAADEYMLDDPLAALSPDLRAGIAALLQPGDDLDALRPDGVLLLGGAPSGDATSGPAPAGRGQAGGTLGDRAAGGDAGIAPGGWLDLAGLRIDVLSTPGHTGGSVVYRIAADPDRPEVLLTGDTLFAGSIGRTDLPGGSASQIFASIATELLTRPDDAVLLPGHGPTSTIGAERVGNPFLRDLA